MNANEKEAYENEGNEQYNNSSDMSGHKYALISEESDDEARYAPSLPTDLGKINYVYEGFTVKTTGKNIKFKAGLIFT